MNLSSWILSIVGMVVLSVIVDIVIPQGQTYKTIKGVFAFVTVLVIASPLPRLFNADFEVSAFFGESSASGEYSTALSDSIFQLRKEKMEQSIEDALSQNGIKGAEIFISCQNDSSFVLVEEIAINLEKAVIKAVDGNILNVEDIKNLVATAANLSPEVIKVYGV